SARRVHRQGRSDRTGDHRGPRPARAAYRCEDRQLVRSVAAADDRLCRDPRRHADGDAPVVAAGQPMDPRAVPAVSDAQTAAPKVRTDLTYREDPAEEGRYFVKDPIRN